MRAMHTTNPTEDQVCGACAEFETARNEPPGDVKYGYCKLRERIERDERGRPAGRLVDVTTRCFMSRWHGGATVPAFEARP